MNSRERMLCAINHQPVDRIPTDIWCTGEVSQLLVQHFGSWETVLAELHIDRFASAGPLPYIGPHIPQDPGNDWVDFWGVGFKAMRYDTGVYNEQSRFPLAGMTTIDELAAYPWPSTDWFDYSQLRDGALAGRETHAVQCGYMTAFYYHNLLRGLEQSLLDPLDDADFTRYLLQRMCDFLYEHHRSIFEACEGCIDVAQLADDFGCQHGPLISLDTFREFYRPHMQRFIDLCHEFGIKVLHHDDGAIRPFLPDFVEMGIDILNPVQWNCPGMELDALKREFGTQFCFHGAVENQRILPFGTPEEVRAEVRKNIDILAADGTGYILASCHSLQPITPIENIIAMYDEAHRYGRL